MTNLHAPIMINIIISYKKPLLYLFKAYLVKTNKKANDLAIP